MEGVADDSFLFSESLAREETTNQVLAVCAEAGLSTEGNSYVDRLDTTGEFDDDGVARTDFY
jgi:hypothetical protein